MKHLIFDAGGVLVYPKYGEWNIPCRAPELLGVPVETFRTEPFLRAYRESVHWLDESRIVPTTLDERRLRLEFVREMSRRVPWPLTEAQQDALADDFTYNIDRYGFFDDLKPWLTRWKARYTLGVLSDAMPSIIDFLDQYGLSDFFKAIVISTHVGATKPDGRMYRAILEALGAAPEDCLFVDDRVCNLEGAQAAGMKAVQMCRAEFPPAELWDGPVARGFEALDGMLETL